MDGRTTFPRVSGGIVLDSFAIVSFFTGLLAALPAGLVLLVGSIGPSSSGTGSAAAVVWGLTVLVFVSRFAQLGIAGDDDGGLFSSTAGPWSGTFLAAARLLLLWALWLLPFVAWALLKSEPQVPAGLPALGLGAFVPRVPFLLTVWSAAGMVLSFAFVAVAAAAPGFGDLFSPGLWRALFPGRMGELFTAMAGTFGPPLAVFVVVLPFAGALAPQNPKLALTALVPFLLYIVGMVLTLQGKLCGAFSAASLAEGVESEPAGTVTPAEGAGAISAAPEAGRPEAAAAAPPAPTLGDPRNLHAAWRARLAEGDVEGALATARDVIPAGLGEGGAAARGRGVPPPPRPPPRPRSRPAGARPPRRPAPARRRRRRRGVDLLPGSRLPADGPEGLQGAPPRRRALPGEGEGTSRGGPRLSLPPRTGARLALRGPRARPPRRRGAESGPAGSAAGLTAWPHPRSNRREGGLSRRPEPASATRPGSPRPDRKASGRPEGRPDGFRDRGGSAQTL